MINNYNRHLIGLLKCNHDLQYVFNEFSCANYITAYLTKNESGMSRLLRALEEELKGKPQIDLIVAFGNILDKHREVTIQEAIFQLLGLPMSKFSRKVKYVNTNHPRMRLGLLKGNYEDLPENEDVFHMSPHQYYEHRPYGNVLGIDFDICAWQSFSLILNFERQKSRIVFHY